MGTNFYKVLEYTPEEKQDIVKTLQSITDNIINNGYLDWNDQDKLNSIPCKRIHLGKRSCGWQFLWNHNDGKYYKPSIDSIREFLEKPGKILDEYEQEFTVDQFFNEEIKDWLWGTNKHHNWTGRKYYIDNPQEKFHYWNHEPVKVWEKSFDAPYGDFIVNGLRFSSSTEFC